MALRTGRAYDPAAPLIDPEKCTLCGLCARICPGGVLELEGGRIAVHQERLFGCIGCGHCATVCPSGAILVSGRDLEPGDIFGLAPARERATHAQLLALLQARRSVRHYRPEEVSREDVERILEAAATAPMGLPPTDVEVAVFHGRDCVRTLAGEMIPALDRMCRIMRPPLFWFLRPFLDRATAEAFRGFLVPVVDLYVREWAAGRDTLFYGAPLGLYFHAAAFADAADPMIAATYAMLAAESLGLGTCMLGFPGHAFQRDRALGEKYGVPRKHHLGVFLAAGHPAVRHQRGVRRRFSRVRWFGKD
jgi:ferredoxin